ncbi:bile acid:sodium symporter family protein [Christiangramia sp. OXR-203]|uniref:bile acid:sodium symporter family protein n=1 Tax=Christiangramia sp. OXR-203 TaxID=3100176 RepID=UPI002AC9BE1A|nr:bile acid:sodium symporter family protein [Christiangramia sp. OXR-203]WPY97497.1 bile acid:sodium symporter family protein [Christiangramia sp. OXR-203]
MRSNWFIIAIFVAIAIAYFLPQGPEILPLKTITDIGIGLIFFFYGLKLSPAEFKEGLMNYKIHIIIHLTTFVVFPLLCIACLPLFEKGLQAESWIALFFLGTLPSTVSSSVVMVALAKGNLPAAIFNASLSGLIGIFATPLWLGLVLESTTDFDFLSVLQKLMLQIVAPLLIGLFLQRFLGNWARKHGKKLSNFDKATIILIIYTSFSNSFSSNIFADISWSEILKMAGIVIVLFFLVYYGTMFASKALKLNTADTITAQFCGTKKSLVHGSVMVRVIFGSTANSGLILLPIMLYHSTQLILIAWFAEKFRSRKSDLQ